MKARRSRKGRRRMAYACRCAEPALLTVPVLVSRLSIPRLVCTDTRGYIMLQSTSTRCSSSSAAPPPHSTLPPSLFIRQSKKTIALPRLDHAHCPVAAMEGWKSTCRGDTESPVFRWVSKKDKIEWRVLIDHRIVANHQALLRRDRPLSGVLRRPLRALGLRDVEQREGRADQRADEADQAQGGEQPAGVHEERRPVQQCE